VFLPGINDDISEFFGDSQIPIQHDELKLHALKIPIEVTYGTDKLSIICAGRENETDVIILRDMYVLCRADIYVTTSGSFPSAGPLVEAWYAHLLDIPTIMISTQYSVSPWTIYPFKYVVRSVDEAVRTVLNYRRPKDGKNNANPGSDPGPNADKV